MAIFLLPIPCDPGKSASFTVCYWGGGWGMKVEEI